MLARLTAILLAMISTTAMADEPTEDVFDRRIEAARHEYRQAIARQIRKAAVVELLILRFDDIEFSNGYGAASGHNEGGGYGVSGAPGSSDSGERFPVAPYQATTSVISKKRLAANECRELLAALAAQLGKPEHGGGALCHFPIHGIRVYGRLPAGEQPGDEPLVFESSFCWVCSNFGFKYPDPVAPQWLDTSAELGDAFQKLLPIPADELKRFEAKFPAKNKTKNTSPPPNSTPRVPAER